MIIEVAVKMSNSHNSSTRSSNSEPSTLNKLSQRKHLFRFRSEFSLEVLEVDKNLLCQRSRLVKRICERDPTTHALKLTRDFRNAFQSIINYLEDDVVPVGSGHVEPDSQDAIQYTELILALCLFAESYEMEDLANRSMDALRSHEYKCNGTLLGRHFRDVYGNTREGSKLRHYCAVATACFLSNAQDTEEHQAGCAAISELFRLYPQFEHDVSVARSTYRQKIRVEKANCNSDENHFGPCEFHAHRWGDICHVTGEKARKSNVLNDVDEIPDSDGHGRDEDFGGHNAVIRKDDVCEEVGTEAQRKADVSVGDISTSRHFDASSDASTAVDCQSNEYTMTDNAASYIPRTRNEIQRSLDMSSALEQHSSPIIDPEFMKKASCHGLIPPAPQSDPPPGYDWFLCYQWQLLRKDPAPSAGIDSPGSLNLLNAKDNNQYEQSPSAAAYGSDFQSPRFPTAADSAYFPARATAPSPPAPVKDEDPYQRQLQEVSLYGDNRPGPDTHLQVQLKAKDDQATELSSTQVPHHPTRARLRKLQYQNNPFKCMVCKNQFPSDFKLRKHFGLHPSHANASNGLLKPPTKAHSPKRAQMPTIGRLRKGGYQTNPFRCTFCKNQFLSEELLQKHFIKNPDHYVRGDYPSQEAQRIPPRDEQILGQGRESWRAFIQPTELIL